MEQYYATIHTSAALLTVEKFSYLRIFLAGETAPAVAGLPTTEACYSNVVEILKQRDGENWSIIIIIILLLQVVSLMWRVLQARKD